MSHKCECGCYDPPQELEGPPWGGEQEDEEPGLGRRLEKVDRRLERLGRRLERLRSAA